MRVFLILICAGTIFIFTCTSHFTSLFESGTIHFQWDPHPRLKELLLPLPAELTRDFLIQKIGHFSAFFILTLLLQTRFQSKVLILIIAISYAALTEFLQLYFTRDGRIFDIGFDAFGILLAVGAGSIFIVRNLEKSI